MPIWARGSRRGPPALLPATEALRLGAIMGSSKDLFLTLARSRTGVPGGLHWQARRGGRGTGAQRQGEGRIAPVLALKGRAIGTKAPAGLKTIFLSPEGAFVRSAWPFRARFSAPCPPLATDFPSLSQRVPTTERFLPSLVREGHADTTPRQRLRDRDDASPTGKMNFWGKQNVYKHKTDGNRA